MDLIILLLSATWGVIALRLFIALAINLDCRAENLAQRKGFTILAFFFPIIIGIIYATKRKSMQKAFKVCSKCGTKADPYANKCPKCGGYMLLEYKNPKRKTLKIISIVLCVVGVLCYGAYQFIGFSGEAGAQKKALYFLNEKIGSFEEEIEEEPEEEEGSFLLYDRNGIAYTDYRNMKYYDKDGMEYTCKYFDSEDELVAFEDANGKEYKYEYCVIDEDGYFVYDEAVEVDENGIYHKQGSDKKYYSPFEVTWDYSGQLQTPFDE